MLVRNAPVTVDLAQAYRQPEQKTVFVRRVARRVGPAAHDGNCEGDVLTRRHGELLEVECRSWLVIAEEQVPCLFVRLDPLALQGRRQVEHHDVWLVISEDSGNIVPANRTRPGFEKGLDPDLFGVGVFRHGFGSFSSAARGRAKGHDSDTSARLYE